MCNFIQYANIHHFKTIRNCEIKACKRINLFISRSAVGANHIVEALSLFSIPFLRENLSKGVAQLIRMESETEVFYNGSFGEPAKVDTNKGFAQISYDKADGLTLKIDTLTDGGLYSIDDKLNLKVKRSDSYLPFIRKYTFNPQGGERRTHSRYLIPPYGSNIFSIINRSI